MCECCCLVAVTAVAVLGDERAAAAVCETPILLLLGQFLAK